MQSSDPRLVFLDSLRGLAIYMVVCIHTLSYCLVLPKAHLQIVSFIVYTIAVPVFFMVDGFLFAYTKSSREDFYFLSYIRQSAFRLMLPWFIFTTAYAFSRYVFELLGFFEKHIIVGNSLVQIIIYGYQSVFAPQMYFLFSLFIIRLASPLFHAMLSWKSRYILIFFAAYYILYRSSIDFIKPVLSIEGGLEPVIHALWGFQFYLAGMVVHKMSLLKYRKLLFLCCCSIFIVLMLLHPASEIFRYKGYLIQYAYLLMFFFLFSQFQEGVTFLKTLGKNTMGIYLLHTPIVLKAVSLLINRWVIDSLSSFLMISVIATIVSYIITIIINNIPYGPIVFGMTYRNKIAS